ncbi:uncharacterized protein LOC114247285 [Bombyx mandarina]|uniref:Uncharacterized protein LOC114247285 n=1 Tax=Bombyx mandarina TaxID=7092 RepID=A0A6J2K2X0_BOMMA|nr:uncharacterized protein LOC114247285 [Bombyx mandarina]
MTNVKLKFLYLLLKLILAKFIVNARPNPENVTDIIIKFSNNHTFIPINPDSDTLVVANDEEAEIDDLKEADAMVSSEQQRDKELSQNSNTQKRVSNEKRNISALLDDLIDSETNRDDTITDLLFKPDSEFVEGVPTFEFLIATRINESETGVNETSRDAGVGDVLKKLDYVELVEVVKAGKENRSAYMLNITGHEVDNDLAPDTILSVFSGFTDVQTLFLACFGTLLPLLAVLFATLVIRCLCRRHCPGFCKKHTGSSASDSSDNKDGNHQQVKSSTEDETGVHRVENRESPPGNGSIFTMTLKNNHLIVETEERNDITKNGRETKMKYSPDNDGIFVVEVQQSSAYRPNNVALQNSPPQDPQISTNQALIHRVPEELDKRAEDDSERSSEKCERDKALALSSTGLSISDLSMSSIGSHNVSYSYGSQMGYEQGPFGYPVYAGYDVSKDDVPEGIVCDNSTEPLISKTPTDPDKPVVTAAIFKQDSIIGSEVPGYCIEGSSDGPLLSDVQAREYSLQHLHDQKKLENGVAVAITEKDSPKKNLNRADSLPVRIEDENEKEATVIIREDVGDVFHGKRPSLPIIKTEIYESVCDAAKTILPRLSSEASSEIYGTPPMITITEESESSKSDGTS